MKIADCFIFYNELGLLEYRLHLLYDVVDYFVLVESTRTFTNKPKPLYYLENSEAFKQYQSKIIHVLVDTMPDTNNAWECERFQRNAIDRGIRMCNLEQTDYVIISDVDEIPNPRCIETLRSTNLTDIATFEQEMYYYNTRTISRFPWSRVKIMPIQLYTSVIKNTPENCRHRNDPHIIKNGGWHFSYFGGPVQISTKIQNFSHQEYNKSQFTDIQLIKERIQKGNDIFDRQNEKWVRLAEPRNIPAHDLLQQYLQKWHGTTE